jgi:hypothetical protein
MVWRFIYKIIYPAADAMRKSERLVDEKLVEANQNWINNIKNKK